MPTRHSFDPTARGRIASESSDLPPPNRTIVTAPLSAAVGTVPVPEIANILVELRGAIAQCLIELRSSELDPRQKSSTISNLCASIARIVGIDTIKGADFTRLSDKELVELGKKLLGEL